MTDNKLWRKAMKILTSELGIVDTGRFISMVKRNTFDYTEWQRTHWNNKSIYEVHEAVVAYENMHD